ncbi:MAG: exodeoxyribonuclease VII large subunit [Clostridia bacterium]
MIISVTQFNTYIKGILDSESMLNTLSIKGEVCNLKDSYSGVYFTLKDLASTLDCFIYKGKFDSLLKNGLEIVASGNINFFTKNARFNFTVTKVELTKNLGQDYLAYILLKEKLEKEGIFDLANKKIVPTNCQTIGIITSNKGAVITDILEVVKRRNNTADTVLYPVRVSGELAINDICEALNYFSSSQVDAVILARGGGSKEDLSVFNNETVVRCLYNCKKPTVSAIGHGIDFTLCDFTADIRAVTPTEAGELLTIDLIKYRQRCIQLLRHIYSSVDAKLNSQIQKTRLSVNKVYYQTATNLASQEGRLSNLSIKLDSLSPLKKFSNGFAQVSKQTKLIGSVSQVKVDDIIDLTMQDGQLKTKIVEIKTQK